MSYQHSAKSYWVLVFTLIGHLAGTAAIFVSLITLGWVVSFVLHFLHSVHLFPAGILTFITQFELCLVYGVMPCFALSC